MPIMRYTTIRKLARRGTRLAELALWCGTACCGTACCVVLCLLYDYDGNDSDDSHICQSCIATSTGFLLHFQGAALALGVGVGPSPLFEGQV